MTNDHGKNKGDTSEVIAQNPKGMHVIISDVTRLYEYYNHILSQHKFHENQPIKILQFAPSYFHKLSRWHI